MSQDQVQIYVSSNKRQVTVQVPVKDSLHGSMLADRLGALPYLKTFNRKYNAPMIEVQCYTIYKKFTIEKLHADLDNMSDLINLPNKDNEEN